MFEVVNLKKTYKNKEGNFVGLKNISFKLGENGIVFLFGASGEGKSTLLNIMSGLDTYDAGGKVLFNGRDIMKMSQKERDYFRSHEIGIIFEKNNLLDDLTVEENVIIGSQLSGKEATQAQVEAALEKVKLKGFGKRKINELSSGEVQRVAIARTLLLNPKVIFLDEPTGSLDKENAKIFWDAIKEVSKNSLVVAISHRDEIVEEYADRVLTIKSGEIISDEYKSRKLKIQDKATFEEKPKNKKKVEKSGNLPFSTSIKIGSKALVANKFKFVAMLVLIALTLVTFALSYLLASFNPNLVKTKTIADAGYNYVVFEKTDKSPVTTADMTKVYANGTSTQFYYIYTTSEKINYSTSGAFTIKGYIEVPQSSSSAINALGQKILYGSYPVQGDGDVKIAISDYVAKTLSKNGVNVLVNGASASWRGFEIKDLVSTNENTIKIAIGGVYYTISAIYETDYTKYVDSNLEVLKGKEDAFNYNNENVYSLIHVGTSKISKIISGKTTLETELTFKSNKRDSYTQTQKVVSLAAATTSQNFINGKTDLSKNEILLPVDLFNAMFNATVDETTFFTLSDTEKSEVFVNALGGNATFEITSKYGQVTTYTVVGLTSADQIVFANNKEEGGLIVTKGCIGEIVELNNFPTFRIATKFTNANDFVNVVTNLTDNGFEYLSEYTASINSAADFIDQLKVVFVSLTVFCLVFSIFCMVTFFADIIRGRKRSIGALRSLGAKSSNVFLIFFLSCLILMLSSLLLGGILSIIADLVINVQLMHAFSIGVTLFHMNGAAFGLMAATGAVVVIFGSLVPIIIYCAKAPIDVIKR